MLPAHPKPHSHDGMGNGCQCTHNVAYLEHGFEDGAHAVVLHGHEEGVYHDAQGDGELCKGVRHNPKEKLLELHPRGAALPDQILLSQAGQQGWAPLFRLLEFCISDRCSQ